MTTGSRDKLIAIWKQKDVPVIYRRGRTGHRLLVKLPFAEDNRARLRKRRKTIPIWRTKYKCWEVPYAWLSVLTNEFLSEFGHTYIIQPYRAQEICAPNCWNAQGHECECSCMGERHGMNNPGRNWKVVSDTFATHWENQELACRYLVKTDPIATRSAASSTIDELIVKFVF